MAEPLPSSSTDDFGPTRAPFFSFSSDSTLLDRPCVEGGDRTASNPPRYRQFHDFPTMFFHQPLVESPAAASSPFSCLQYCSSHYSHSTRALLLTSFAELEYSNAYLALELPRPKGVGDDGDEPAKTPFPFDPNLPSLQETAAAVANCCVCSHRQGRHTHESVWHDDGMMQRFFLERSADGGEDL